MSVGFVPRQRYWTGAGNEGYEGLPVALTRHKNHNVLFPGVARKKRSQPLATLFSRYRGTALHASREID
jgi:hypothetical protein